MDNLSQEHFIIRFCNMVKKINSGEKLNDCHFSSTESVNLGNSCAGFLTTVGFEGNPVLASNNEVLSRAFKNSEFFVDEYIVGSPEYSTLIKNNKRLSELLEEGDKIITVSDVDLQKRYPGSYKIYEKLGNHLRVYDSIVTFTDQPKIFRNISSEFLQKALLRDYRARSELSGDTVDIYKAQEFLGSIKQVGSDVYMYGPGYKLNPFSQRLIRLFNSSGEITDFSKINLPEVIRAIRDTEAHKSEQQYYNSVNSYGGRICRLEKLKMTALVSNFWFNNLLSLSCNPWCGDVDNLEVLYVPRGKRAIHSEADLDSKLDGVKILSIQFAGKVPNIAIKNEIDKLCLEYSAIPITNVTLKEFIAKRLSDFATVSNLEEKPVDTRLLKAKLLDDKGFYTICGNEKDNIKKQTDWIKYIVEDVYGLDLVRPGIIGANGKVSPLKISLTDLQEVLDNLIVKAQEISGLPIKACKFPQASDERIIVLSAFCIFHNLIHNEFMDCLDSHSTMFKGYHALGESAELQRELMIMDMNMFTIKDKTEYQPKLLIDRLAVLRAVRNSVAHNNFNIKFAKNGKIQDATFLFNLENRKNVTISVNCLKFLEFINNPLFVNFGTGFENSSEAKNAEQLIAQILKELKAKYGEKPVKINKERPQKE